MSKQPVVLSVETLANTQLFHIERLYIQFANGVARHFERLKMNGRGTVMIVPVLDSKELLLIREYAVGSGQYELGFPCGRIEVGESILEAANRELMEEVGYTSQSMTIIKAINLAPGHFDHKTYVILAEGLRQQMLSGDEPEPIEVTRWPLKNSELLLARDDFAEARAVSALLMIRNFLDGRCNNA